jgi:hypothetical protein
MFEAAEELRRILLYYREGKNRLRAMRFRSVPAGMKAPRNLASALFTMWEWGDGTVGISMNDDGKLWPDPDGDWRGDDHGYDYRDVDRHVIKLCSKGFICRLWKPYVAAALDSARVLYDRGLRPAYDLSIKEEIYMRGLEAIRLYGKKGDRRVQFENDEINILYHCPGNSDRWILVVHARMDGSPFDVSGRGVMCADRIEQARMEGLDDDIQVFADDRAVQALRKLGILERLAGCDES